MGGVLTDKYSSKLMGVCSPTIIYAVLVDYNNGISKNHLLPLSEKILESGLN